MSVLTWMILISSGVGCLVTGNFSTAVVCFVLAFAVHKVGLRLERNNNSHPN